MKLTDAYPSKWLKAEDLEDGDMVVVINDVRFEEFTDPKTKRPDNKPVIYFEGKDSKPMVLNKTNFKVIAQVLGSDDSDDWIGKRIALYATKVESFGEMTLGIRVRLKAPMRTAPTHQPRTVQPAQARRPQTVDPYEEGQVAKEDLPF